MSRAAGLALGAYGLLWVAAILSEPPWAVLALALPASLLLLAAARSGRGD